MRAPCPFRPTPTSDRAIATSGGARLLRRYRGWPRSAQIAIPVIVLFLLVGLFGSEEEPGTRVAVDRGETTTSEATTTTTATTTTVPPATTAVPTTAAPVAAGLPAGDDSTVAEVIDGDMIAVAGGTRVRLIGMDTPETKDARAGVQCFGREAAAHTEKLIPLGTPVRLAYDVERTDRYGRSLAYVYRLRDGLFVNAALLRDGFAQVATFPPNVAHVDEFQRLQREARQANRGLWSACAAAATTTTARATTTTKASGNCDPAYPDVCIPPPPPDLDCGDIPHRRFRVLPPDPHGFDGNDNDGIGCESG